MTIKTKTYKRTQKTNKRKSKKTIGRKPIINNQKKSHIVKIFF